MTLLGNSIRAMFRLQEIEMVPNGHQDLVPTTTKKMTSRKIPSLKKICCQTILVAKGIGKERVDEGMKKAFIEALPLPLVLKDMLQVYHKEKFVLGFPDDAFASDDEEANCPNFLAKKTMRLRT